MRKILYVALSSFLTFSLAAQHTWTPKADLPNANQGRHHPVCWGIGDYGYALTGTTSGQATTNHFFKYDPSIDSWSTLTPFPGPARSFAIGDMYQGEGYIGFGFTSTTGSLLNDLWKYNPDTETWTQLASCPCEGRRHPVFSINQNEGKLYVGLGDNLQMNLRDWWVYDIDTDTWAELETFPGARRHHPFHFAIGDYVYAGLGHGSAIYDDFYRYDPVDSSWAQMASSPDVRAAGTEFSYMGYGFVLSGDAQNHLPTNPSIFWRYNPNNDTWSSLPPHPGFSRWAPGSFVVNGVLYFFAGQDGQTQNLVGSMYSFNLESYLSNNIFDVDVPLNIYPNPSSDEIRVETEVDFSHLEILSMDGRVVRQDRFDHRINVENLPSGTYLLHLITESGERVQKKFIVQK